MTILFASKALQTVLLAYFLLDLSARWSTAAATGGSFALPSGLLAKFQLESVSAHSIVVKMVGGTAGTDHTDPNPLKLTFPLHNSNGSVERARARSTRKLEMKITIFDLDRLREFRRSELTANINHQHSQLFSFDGLLSSTWFAIRIDYRLLYYQTANIDTGDAGGFQDFPTKQELIVQTKNESSMSSSSSSGHEEVGGHVRQESSSWPANSVPLEEESVFLFDHIYSSPTHLNVTIATVFAMRPKLTTLIVPELRCLRGTIKPPAVRVLNQVTVSFDLKKVAGPSIQGLPASTQYYTNHNKPNVNNPSHTVYLDKGGVKCYQLCIFPFIRADILEHGQQTFRGKEFCDSLDVARQLAFQHNNKHRHHAPKLRSPFSTRELSTNFEGEWSLSPSSARITTSSTVYWRVSGLIVASLLYLLS